MSRTRNIADLASQTLATDSEVSAAVSTAVAKSIVDAKGDLIVATAADTVARLAVGTNGFVLTADSAETTGLKWAAAASGKILQVVRTVDTTSRQTTSTTYVDSNLSVTITPQKSDSTLVLIMAFSQNIVWSAGDIGLVYYRITDSSNNIVNSFSDGKNGVWDITGANTRIVYSPVSMFAYVAPNTTSSVTYKMRHRTYSASIESTIDNNNYPGQMYAIEVSA